MTFLRNKREEEFCALGIFLLEFVYALQYSKTLKLK